MSATVMNGKPRKQLCDELTRLEAQLDRHDAILDALSEGLTGAVKDAAVEGTKLAVKDAVIELLTDPTLRAALHQATAPPATPKAESVWGRLKAKVAAATTRARAKAADVSAAVHGRVRAAKDKAAGLGAAARFAWQVRRIALVGLGVGVVVAGVAYAASHGFAAALSGVGATVTAVVVQAGLWIRGAAKRLALA
jgi:hypothetical protein